MNQLFSEEFIHLYKKKKKINFNKIIVSIKYQLNSLNVHVEVIYSNYFIFELIHFLFS